MALVVDRTTPIFPTKSAKRTPILTQSCDDLRQRSAVCIRNVPGQEVAAIPDVDENHALLLSVKALGGF